MNRKTKRALKKQLGQTAQEKLTQQVSQFSKLPENCSACQKEFDKTDKSMLESWSVVAKQEMVRLFCPECIEKTKEVIENYERR